MKIGTTRAETFSDGVIAILITIMVLSIKLPIMGKELSAWQIRHELESVLPYVGAYAFSFMMIGIFWTNHHHMFHLLEKTDERLLLLNLFHLFWMSLIPIATAFVGTNLFFADSVALYGFIMLMTTLSFALMRSYTLKKGLVHTDKDQNITSKINLVSLRARTKSYLGTMAYLVAIPFSYINIVIAYICLVIPPIIFFIPDGIDDEKLAQKIEDKNANSSTTS
jgi:uncharacterized membrane protein